MDDDARSLIERMIKDGPIATDQEYGDSCWFCGEDGRGYSPTVFVHADGCVWIEAMDALGHELPVEHERAVHGPRLVPPFGGQVLDLTFTYGSQLPPEAFAPGVRKVTTDMRVMWGFPWDSPDDGLRLAVYESESTARQAARLLASAPS